MNGGTQWKVEGNYINRVDNAVALGGSEVVFTGNFVRSNSGNTTRGAPSKATITGNTFINTSGGNMWIMEPTDSIVASNYIENQGSNNIAVFSQNMTGTVFVSNYFKINSNGKEIWMQNDNSTWLNNYFDSEISSVFHIDGSNNWFQGNHFPNGDGFTDDGSGNRWIWNFSSDPTAETDLGGNNVKGAGDITQDTGIFTNLYELQPQDITAPSAPAPTRPGLFIYDGDGTDTGLYRSDPGNSQWVKITDETDANGGGGGEPTTTIQAPNARIAAGDTLVYNRVDLAAGDTIAIFSSWVTPDTTTQLTGLELALRNTTDATDIYTNTNATLQKNSNGSALTTSSTVAGDRILFIIRNDSGDTRDVSAGIEWRVNRP